MSSSNSVGAYGAGWATGHWDPLVYFRKPEVILRLVAWVSSSSVRSGYDFRQDRYRKETFFGFRQKKTWSAWRCPF